MATLDMLKTPLEMNDLLPIFIKNLLGLRYTLLSLNNKILSITRAQRECNQYPPPFIITSNTSEIKWQKCYI
ncbi:5815_t:CDS:2 [Funneliformis mosseae]|uniref:5815_t:CDS:1 n=1 Tax=Funneliformis mosseae TaxID=27381 RepID=A0A9N9EYS9_FUNMO|nr:5815_t:CDS:2 [Funneliformis mosseae]